MYTHDRGSARGFTTALSLQPLVTREVFLDLLRERLVAVDAVLAEGELLAAEPPGRLPPHLPALIDLWGAQGRTERAWLVETIAAVEAGSGAFAGEPSSWSPPADDPGWAMQADRERYRQALGLPD